MTKRLEISVSRDSNLRRTLISESRLVSDCRMALSLLAGQIEPLHHKFLHFEFLLKNSLKYNIKKCKTTSGVRCVHPERKPCRGCSYPTETNNAIEPARRSEIFVPTPISNLSRLTKRGVSLLQNASIEPNKKIPFLKRMS